MTMTADQVAALRRAIARLQRDAEMWSAQAKKWREDTPYRRTLERYAREAAQDAILLQELLP